MKIPKTICINCKFFCGSAKNVWYDNLCEAPGAKAKQEIDPITGELAYIGSCDDFGRPYARDINDGNCPFFKEKS